MNANTFFTALIFSLYCSCAYAQLPKPAGTFGFEVGEDYKLASYDQMLAYYTKLSASTPRVKVTNIGYSVAGRPIKLIFVSSAKNIKSLEKWRLISEKMARAKITPKKAVALSQEGKAIVWFDGGMHATERAHAQMTAELIYNIASEETDEMKKIRDRIITLVVPVINPDGLDIVKGWYDNNLGTPYETSNPPVLYQKYVGHDNNRDWFMNNMPETRAATTVLYNRWYPQIVHNHHQPAPDWARIFIPPFRSPVNNRIHPGVTTGVNLVGAAMASRFAMKKMPGVVASTLYEMWWNGGMRTTPYYHNQIGILTEVAHTSPTPRFYSPDSIPKTVGGKASNGTEVFYPHPWQGGDSHFRDAIDYMLTASMAVLDLAADKKEEFLLNIYKMGRDAIEDTTGAYAYVVPAAQWDRKEAINMVNIMMQGGIEVHKATQEFRAANTFYKTGDYILYGGQAFRPYLADLMEQQHYPDLYKYPGGPPIRPYDLTGWTLPMQMGVRVDRIDAPFEADVELVKEKIKVGKGSVSTSAGYGFVLSNKENISALAVNRLLKEGEKVFVSQSRLTAGEDNYEAGCFLIEKGNQTLSRLNQLSAETGLSFSGINAKPSSAVNALNGIKIGIYKSWVPNIDEGWTRWVLEQFEFNLDTLHDSDIRKQSLSTYTAIILPSQKPSQILHGHPVGSMPNKFTGGMGIEGLLALEKYVKNGGVLIVFDKASDLAIDQFGLPVVNVTRKLSTNDFSIPGSLVRIKMNSENPLAWGMPSEVAASFSRSRAFKIDVPAYQREGGKEKVKPAPKPDVSVVARYASTDIIMSGWGLGEKKYIRDKGAMLNVGYGKGNVVLFGFRPQFRGQTRATYQLIFNAIYMGAQQ